MPSAGYSDQIRSAAGLLITVNVIVQKETGRY